MENKTVFQILHLLDKNKISFTLNRSRPDTIRIDATLYGLRIEIECFEDNHIEISTFRGSEDVEGGYDYLLKVIQENSLD